MTDVRVRIGQAVLLVTVFLAAFLYRFNALGGALGGFSNDEFGYLARARQMQAGEVPFRDFNDPGWFLTDYMSAAAQWLGGFNLRSEALLTVGMLALGAALTYVLARRASGSVAIALAAAAIQVALDPRHYNYPKIVVYAVGLALAWAYVDRPSRVRLAALGALTGVAFLFRHDNLVYLGALALVAIAARENVAARERLRAAVGFGVAAAAFVVPFLLFLALSGGIGEYFRAAFVYVQRDAERTSFSLPRFSWDPAKPLVGIAQPSVDVNVRWRAASDEERRQRETAYKLAKGMPQQDGATWRYRLEDVSRANIESLVRDPLVEDTHGIDRGSFAPVEAPAPLRFETQLDTVQNATAFLYYSLLALPVIVALVWLRLVNAGVPTRVLSSRARILPLLVLAAGLNMGLLSRGSTNIRIPDVGVTSAILLAWLIASVAGRDLRLIAPNRVSRVALRVTVVVMLCLTAFGINGLAGSTGTLADGGFTQGPVAVARRAAAVWRELAVHPTAVTQDPAQPSLLQIASYIDACTAPDDKVFVLGSYPELYYFSDRRFAGGHAWLLPYYYSDDSDESLIVERLRQARPPLVLTESPEMYEAEYRDVFEQVDEYLRQEYSDAGTIAVAGAPPLGLRVRADRKALGTYEPLGLPCFTSGDRLTIRHDR